LERFNVLGENKTRSNKSGEEGDKIRAIWESILPLEETLSCGLSRECFIDCGIDGIPMGVRPMSSSSSEGGDSAGERQPSGFGADKCICAGVGIASAKSERILAKVYYLVV
jgi:hypothetical protein